MLKIFLGWSILLFLVSFAAGCSENPPPVQVVGNPDDVMTTPGGPAYRANVQQEGIKNPWPPVQSSEITLADDIYITYRAQIETQAGQTRNNIVYIRTSGNSIDDVQIRVGIVHDGMHIKQGIIWRGPMGSVAQVLQIEISKEVKAGQYLLKMDVNINGMSYGQIPCTITVT